LAGTAPGGTRRQRRGMAGATAAHRRLSARGVRAMRTRGAQHRAVAINGQSHRAVGSGQSQIASNSAMPRPSDLKLPRSRKAVRQST
jgi:hypothetical protein